MNASTIEMEDPATQNALVSHKILVVIPTLNEAENISALIEHLLHGISDEQVALIVSDGGSTDNTQELVRSLMKTHPCVDMINNPKKLQSAGINLAVAHFGQNSDIIIRCDAHSSYPDNYVSDLVASLNQSGADSVVVPMDTIGETCIEKAIAWASDSKIGSGGSAHRGGHKSGFVDHGHHAAMRTSAFNSIGGYDETFSHNEDAELDCRLRHGGGRIFLDANIRVAYRPRPNLVGLWKQYFNYGCGRSRTIRRHPSSLRLRQLLVPAHVAVSLLLLLLFICYPSVKAFLIWPFLYLSILIGVSILTAVKQKSRCGLLVAPAAFTMHTAWALGLFFGLVTIRESVWTRKT